MLDSISLGELAAVVITAIAAFTDLRTGFIPNWLTLPPLVVAPLLYGALAGPRALLMSVVGIFVCGIVPYVLFRRDALGGGDVKLFAAIGALLGGLDTATPLGGLALGIEAMLFAFVAMSVSSLVILAWRGKLLQTLANAVYLGLNPLLPKRMRRDITPELMSRMRMGGAIFAGCIITIGRHIAQTSGGA